MGITARGAIARTPNAPVSIEDFTIDDPGPNEVLVRIVPPASATLIWESRAAPTARRASRF